MVAGSVSVDTPISFPIQILYSGFPRVSVSPTLAIDRLAVDDLDSAPPKRLHDI
ncbi:hypothetical protein DPMN_076765 [Dreissena polymorpha]|uniref:Uncharacterized protein n=1 Tax=Dreissena polymorpha TaxID=45954 RepID=A0A9D3YN00_DREPO|nr:hypothetical protein DPMN_076765 [Dreissena polymorpha]